MTALKTTPQATIQQIQTLLSESYGSGFTIFKELIQNADDVGASRLLLAGHDGFPDANNVLLRAPGIFVANDGPVSSSNWEGLQLAAGGSKGGDGQAVGRFGLGQKALYHLCDAYPVFARIDGGPQPTTMILNPYEEIAEADHARAWKSLSAKDEMLLAEWADGQGMAMGLVLYIPLRTDTLRPSSDSRISLTRAQWNPRDALKDIVDGEQLHATISCLRHLARIDIECPGEIPWRAEVQPGGTRLSGPGDDAQRQMEAAFGGRFTVNGKACEVHGAQRSLTDGTAVTLRQEDDWPSAWTLTGLDKAKATPHGASIICRHPVGPGKSARLRIWQGVYLPLGDPAKDRSVVLGDPALPGNENVDIVVHGDFFVSSNRASILVNDGNRGQDAIKLRWNEALQAEASLPCVLDAVAQAVLGIKANNDRYELIRALGESRWWGERARAICGGRALVRRLDGSDSNWRIEKATQLRPMPSSEATRPRRLTEAWKGFLDWCTANEFVLAQGVTLGEARPAWEDRELAELVAGFAPASLSSKDAANTLVEILDYNASTSGGEIGPLARAAMANAFRAAMHNGTKLAPMAQLRRLTLHLPHDQVLVLPKSVTDPELLARLAELPDTLCIRAEWISEEQAKQTRRLARDEAVSLLAVLEPVTQRPSRIFDQALALIGLVLQNGPTLAELARDSKAASLKVIPVVRVDDRADIMLSPAEVLDLMREKLLFHHGPHSQLEKLASAIVEPVIYHLRQNIALTPPPGMSLASSNTVSDKVAVLGKVLQFGPILARVELFKELREHMPAPLMRRLITGEPGLRDQVTLARLVGLPVALGSLVHKLMADDVSIRLLDPAIADKLGHEEARKTDIEDLDLAWLGEQLVRRRSFVEPFSENQAETLLTSGLSKEVLMQLALHRAMNEEGLHRADTLLRGGLNAVPVTMRSLVRNLDPWPDPRASAVQNDLIVGWSPQRQVRLALDSAEPHRFCSEIAEVLGSIASLEDSMDANLRARDWLAVDGRGRAPRDVLDLPICAAEAWTQVMAAQTPVLREHLSPELLSALDRHRLVDDRATAFRRVLRDAAESRLAGLIVDTLNGRADLTKLAHARCELAEGAWPIVASALRNFSDEEALRGVMAGIRFADPDLDAVVDQLNALARIAARDGQVGEAARRLWRAGFEKHAPDLRIETDFLPADLLVESEAGRFARADELALSASGVESRDLLARQWQFDVPANHSPAALSKEVASRPIGDMVEALFKPFQPFHELHTAVLMVLAMLGRDKGIRRVASQFMGNPDFDDICADLDERSRRQLGLYDPLADHMARLRLVVVPVQDGRALALSAAGTIVLAAAEREGALLYGCLKAGDGSHNWQLTMSPIEPRDLTHATNLLRGAVKKLVEPIGMRMQNQSSAVLAQFDGYLASDQATLDELIADIRDGLAERIKKLTRGTYLKSALSRYDDDRKQGRHEQDDTAARQRAKDNLWAAISRPEAGKELLASVREKMLRRNYAPSRTLFELFQNAVDAARQKGQPSDVRVEAERDETGAICHLRFIHWGRPVNVPGGPLTPARYARDLDNMLDLDSSEKEADHGKHGLGFKTTHMLSDNVGVASGRLRFRIKGGMIPEKWEDGRALQQLHNTKDAPATIIDMPISPGLEHAAADAWNCFVEVAPFLPVTAPEIGEMVIKDGGETRSGEAAVTEVAPGIAAVQYGHDQRSLRLDLGRQHYLYVKLIAGTPVPFAKGWSRLWNLAPLDGETVNAAWLIDGRFEMDQGRRGLHGQGEDKRRAMRALGGPLGDRLVELFQGWDEIAPIAGLAVDGRDDFFALLIDRMIDDTRDQLALELHGRAGQSLQVDALRGLAALVDACPVVPLSGGGLVCADEVEGVYRNTLEDPVTLQRVRAWGDYLGFHNHAINAGWAANLEALGFDKVAGIDLGVLAERLFSGGGVDPFRAAAFGTVFNSSERQNWHPEERQRAERALRDVLLLPEDGSYVRSNQLLFPQDTRETQEGETERQRAAFAPAAGRLNSDYTGNAVEFAHLVRALAGYSQIIVRKYLATANQDSARLFAALTYLADRPSEIGGIEWLSTVADLQSLKEYRQLSRQQQLSIEARLVNNGENPTSPQSAFDFEDDVVRSAEAILQDVASWWEENRFALVARHDRLTYGELCDPADLIDMDDVAWFTLLSLGSFQTLGRITPQQSRGFIERCVNEGWWRDLATIDESDRELKPYVQRLLDWTEIGAADDYLMWRRCLGDMCMIARHLETYREIFLNLPQMVRQHDDQLALRDLLRPSSSHIVARMGLDAAPIARSLGMGANWIVRELARRGVYDEDDAEIVQPFAWSARLRIRHFASAIRLGDFESGIDEGRALYDAVLDEVGIDLPFGTDGDLPLELLNTREPGRGWLPARTQILDGTWIAPDLDEVTENA
ncbi:sacsin N-terminal ATP-binding-like domain-containing protein [Sphingobium sp. YBL2]|uniref:sacsin N-terminal ATP-binding-like domain-containing protein n=1 Tax=Sphingobium sp. (strain YBL2) TaxID=484429 RepID=UPI000784E687|nr:hypothetical protein [Sphingobium sp. YBL2]